MVEDPAISAMSMADPAIAAADKQSKSNPEIVLNSEDG